MDNPTLSMQVVKSDQNLLGHGTDDGEWDALVVISLHNFQKINSKDLEHHNEVLSVGPRMNERVEELYCMAIFDRIPALFFVNLVIHLILVNGLNPVSQMGILCDNVKDLNFVVSGLCVVTRALLHLESNVSVVHIVTC